MNPMPRRAAVLLGALALSACGSSGDSQAGGKADNSRILEGSISDEMIPYEKLRSEPPAAKIEESEGGGGKVPGGAASSAGAPAGAAPAGEEASAAPAPEPDPAPEAPVE